MNNQDYIVNVNNVTMVFNLATELVDSLKEYVLKLLQGKLMMSKFRALKGVSLQIERGDAVALIGSNGSGKSTLLKVIAGVMSPTEGSVSVKGSIAPLIELGAGFDMELTARENVFLNGAVLGYNRKFMQEHFDNIIDSAELWEFVDVPVKNFSSGMISRLGFAIATEVRADVLIVDEVLAVGDFRFQEKCMKRMEEMMAAGTTLLFVSHDIDQVRTLCKKAALLEKGRLVMFGDVNEACDLYEQDYEEDDEDYDEDEDDEEDD